MSSLQILPEVRIQKFLQNMRDRRHLDLQDAIGIGEVLAEQKSRLGHGKWLLWLADKVPFSERRARNYMRLYDQRESLKLATVADLGAAYKLLEAPQEGGKPKRSKGKTSATTSATTPASGESSKPAPPVEAVPTDGDGKEIPPHLRTVFESRPEFARLAQSLVTVKAQVKKAMDDDPVSWSQFNFSAFKAAIENARGSLVLSGPYIICSYCSGVHSKNCRACKGVGFLTKAQARCVAQELRPQKDVGQGVDANGS